MPLTIDDRPCVPVDPTLTCQGQGLGCRGNKVATDCMTLQPCDDSVPRVVLNYFPILGSGLPEYPQVILEWLGERSGDEIRVMVLMTEYMHGPVHDVNYMRVFPDQPSPGTSKALVGTTLDENYRYLLAVRRERDGKASPWTTVWMGEANHQRAFSQGFAVGYE